MYSVWSTVVCVYIYSVCGVCVYSVWSTVVCVYI